jgi:hypothetical protein
MSKLERTNTIISLASAFVAAGIAIGYAKAKFEGLEPKNVVTEVMESIGPDLASAKVQLPVGSVVAVWLDEERIKQLGPAWQPANGDTCQVKNSIFFGKPVPNLMGRYVLGGEPMVAAQGDGPGNQAGSWEITLRGKAAGADHQNYRQSSINMIPFHERGGKFIVDTDTNEEAWAEHDHNVTVGGANPGPPHRKLTYLIKVL